MLIVFSLWSANGGRSRLARQRVEPPFDSGRTPDLGFAHRWDRATPWRSSH